MLNRTTSSHKAQHLDVYAVVLVIALALAVRFNLIPAIKW